MSPAVKNPSKPKVAPGRGKRAPVKATTKSPAKVNGAAKEVGAPKPGVDPATAAETAKATKQSVAKGRKSSDVLTIKTPAGQPTNRDEWDAMVLTAKAEHESYLKWRRDGQPGGAKAQPKRPTLDKLSDLKASGVTRVSLPAVERPVVKASGAGRHTGTIAEGKTAAGLDRMDDAATVAWIRKADPTREATVGALHKQFRAAGYGANAKRFARLIDQARASK